MRKTKAFKTFLEQVMNPEFIGNDELLWESRLNHPVSPWVARTERLQYGRSTTQKNLFAYFPSTDFKLVTWNDLSVAMYITHDVVKDMVIAEEWLDVADMQNMGNHIVHYSVIAGTSGHASIYRIELNSRNIVACGDDLPKGVYNRIGVLCHEVIRRLNKCQPRYIERNVRFCDSSNTDAYTLQTLLDHGQQLTPDFSKQFTKWCSDVWCRIEFQFSLYTK